MRVLVTGANGQLGSEVVAELAARSEARRREKIDVVACAHGALDVCDRDAVMTAMLELEPQVVIHLAAFTAVDACESERDRAWATNALATRHVVQAARLVGAHVAYVSTDYVFDGTLARAYTEWDITNPLSVYGQSKLAGEHELADDGLVVRTSWVVGRNGSNFVKTILQLLRSGTPLRVVTDQRASPTVAHDLARTLVSLSLERYSGTVHVTNQGATSWYEFARTVVQEAGSDPDAVTPITTAELDPPRAARRPANSELDNAVLRLSGATLLPHWQESISSLVQELAR